MSDEKFVALVPVKPLSRGKSRLVGLPDEQRRLLAEAFALDTLSAVDAASAVTATLVVTDDFRFARTLRSLFEGRGRVIPDGVSDDVNGSLRLAAAEARRHWPLARPVALCADLPALTGETLDEVLRTVADRAPDASAFVPDRLGTGSTLYSAPWGLFRPRFGTDSRERHLAGGALEVADVPERARTDVDEHADLGRALVTGVGPATARATGRA